MLLAAFQAIILYGHAEKLEVVGFWIHTFQLMLWSIEGFWRPLPDDARP